MGREGLGFQFGVELDGDEPGVGGDFDHFDEMGVGGKAGEDEAGSLELGTVAVVDFVAVAVAFGGGRGRGGRRR